MDQEEIIQKIIANPLFLKLKNVVENNPYHDHETVYDHLLKTHRIAKEQISGDFIKDENAKKLFLEFVNEDFGGVIRKDLMLVTALIHDIGKILYYKDNGKENSLRHEEQNGNTRMPGHEFHGSTIVPELLKDTGLSETAIKRIADVVRLHDTFNDGYLKGVSDWPIDKIVDDVKSRSETLYKETLFNIYCDVFTAKPSEESIKKIVEIFNSPSLYSQREYFIK